jgi:glucose/arabinose dehydrogenase
MVALVLALGSTAVALPQGASAVELPPGFQAQTLPIPRDYKTGLQSPTAIDFAPDGTMFVAERSGRIKKFSSPTDSTPELFASFTPEVNARGDRGLLGMKLDPGFPARPYVYVSYTYDAPIGGVAPTHAETEDGSDGCAEAPPNFTDCLVSGRVSRFRMAVGTGQAAGGAMNAEDEEEVLVNNWCQQFLSHSMSDIEFDSSGALVVGGGEGASWDVADSGQFGNPCGDPSGEGGSLRAQDLRTPDTPGDPTGYSGALIRIDPDTGEALPGNPAYAGADVPARRILAYGFRNPFRFEFRPGSDELYVGDVGWERFEELDRLTSPPALGQGLPNFGWPCYEGAGPLPNWQSLGAPLCESLYQANPSEVTSPFFEYIHIEPGLFPGDKCDPASGASISGLAFYKPEGFPVENVLPAAYDGALFLADASRSCIWVMKPGPGGKPDPSTLENFATAVTGQPPAFTPVDLVFGPEGALYFPDFWDDSIVRIRYFANDQPPVAALSVDHSYGANPLTVHFDAGSSSDDGGQLHYAWDLDGDGEFDDGADQPTVQRTYTDPVNVEAKVRVTDSVGWTDVAAVHLYPGDVGAPVPSIDSPGPALEWSVGDSIFFSGSAPDPGDAAPRLDWEVVIQHCPSGCHAHLHTTIPNVSSGQFTAPVHEYPSHLELILIATDSRGLSAQTAVELFPRLATVELDSEPSGIPLTINATTAPSPISGIIISGGGMNISAPGTALVGGVSYTFGGWSDGGSRSHTISSRDSTRFVAHYNPPASPPPPPPVNERSPGRVGVRLVSHPKGIRLRFGSSGHAAPFTREVDAGTATSIVAPSKVKLHGRFFVFRRWSSGQSRRQEIRIDGPATYVAEYGAKPPR